MTKRSWKIIFSETARKEFSKMDKPIQKRIYSFLSEKLTNCDNPRTLGKPLKGALADFWSFRVGDYRILIEILDSEMLIQVFRVEHRKEVYKP